jgi:hypothetical protein
MAFKYRSLTLTCNGEYYFFEPFTGMLLKAKVRNGTNPKPAIKKRVFDYVRLNAQPYALPPVEFTTAETFSKSRTAILYAKFLTCLLKLQFSFGRICLFFNRPCFTHTKEALSFYRKNIYPNKQNDLCLARCFFAAATSKSFRKNGVLFIGVFLPSKSMHAWILEDGAHTDPQDHIWINYEPVAAIYYE